MTRSSASTRMLVVTREDFLDTFRERQAYFVIGIYVVFALLITYNLGNSARNGPPVELVSQLYPVFALLTPVFAIGFFSSSVVEKRVSGSLKVILGLPISRRSVVIGTMLSRSLLISLAAIAGMVAAGLLGSVTPVRIDAANLVGATGLLILLGTVFTTVAVAISTLSRSITRSMLSGFAVWAVFAFQFWDYLPMTVLYARHGLSFPDDVPRWVDFVSALNPLAAYAHLVDGLFGGLQGGGFITPPAEPAFFERPAFAFGVLCLWVVLTTGFAVYRFRRTDL